MKFIKLVFATLVAVIFASSIAAYLAYRHVQNQGLSNEEIAAYSKATIRRDQRGVISIRASNWDELAEAQGFVTASERMFQLDLMRRKADGALSELFGTAALEFDRKQRAEAWRYYANLANDSLPMDQKRLCDSFARGVNSFLDLYPGRVGTEYSILRTAPKPWSCADSLLVVLLMSNNMSQSWSRDLSMKKWHEALPVEWWSFVFPLRHPWNKLWVETPNDMAFRVTLPTTALPFTKLKDADFKQDVTEQQAVIDGSNSWAYRGKNGAWLANDPHLGNQVPQLWIPMRLEMTDGWWALGATLPGVPGILIGMNAKLAWAITNNGEDTDDAVIASPTIEMQKDTSQIFIRGGKSETIQIRRTDKGPVVRELEDGSLIVRQWVAFKPGLLNLPIEALDRSTDWDSFNKALDNFRFVPLNFTMLDHVGNMGLRVSGCEIRRQNNGDYAESWDVSNWATTCDSNPRRRLYFPVTDGPETIFISTANEQIWADGKLHNWADDDRASRLRELLSKSADLTFDDMRLMQLDTVSRYHRNVVQWLIKNGNEDSIPLEQRKDWQNWDGDTRTCPQCMSEANDAALLLDQIILKQIEQKLAGSNGPLPRVRRNMDRARVITLIESPQTVQILGVESKSLATGIMQSLARTGKRTREPWQIRNRWDTQHPFVGRIPLIGKLFAIDAPVQFGSSAVLRAEKPHHGPSTRMIWVPSNPDQSVWSFPTGVSGHPLSPHYQDWSKIWQNGGVVSVPLAI